MCLQDDVNRQTAFPPYYTSTPFPNRSVAEIKRRENDYRLSEADFQRVTELRSPPREYIV